MSKLNNYIRDYLTKLTLTLGGLTATHLSEKIEKIIDVLEDARKNHRMIYMMGNGGSASTASHFACDLFKLTNFDFPDYNIKVLNEPIPTILAYANDENYNLIFERQIRGIMKPFDVLIAFSGSGNSENIIRAIKYAKEEGARTIGFCGYDGGELKKIAQHCLHVPRDNMQIVEDIHLILTHIISTAIRDNN